MAEKIDDIKTKAGRLIRVKNTKKRKLTNAKDVYYCLWVEDADGDNERALLITEVELERIKVRTEKNPEDSLNSEVSVQLENVKLVPGRFIPVYNTNKKHWKEPDVYNAVLVEGQDKSRTTLLITSGEIERFEFRAKQNPEDIPDKSFLTDLFD